jgi:hypothetical protein
MSCHCCGPLKWSSGAVESFGTLRIFGTYGTYGTYRNFRHFQSVGAWGVEVPLQCSELLASGQSSSYYTKMNKSTTRLVLVASAV